MVQSCFTPPRVVVLLNSVGHQTSEFIVHRNRLPILISSTQSIPLCNQPHRSQRRHAHSKRHVSTTVIVPSSEHTSNEQISHPTTSTPLSCLPWTNLIRSYAITAVSSVPLLLRPSLTIMTFLANSKHRFLNPDHNRVLHALLKKSFYVQFCAGETPAEVQATIKSLKSMGYKGVILGHAREVVLSKKEHAALGNSSMSAAEEQRGLEEIAQWRKDTLETIQLTERDDFVALKFTGAGRQALQSLKSTEPCSEYMRNSISEMCTLAKERGVSLLFDAEQASLQQGIDNWTLYFMRLFNKSGKAVVYGTYQAYSRRAPKILAQHLAAAQQDGFVLGVKLVRGAYINSDPRELFWDTIEDTHKCYDNLARCVMQREYDGLLEPVEGETAKFPHVNLVLASHNADSVQKAQAIRDAQASAGQPLIRMAYGQLQGMADHVSCGLVKESRDRQFSRIVRSDVPEAYKYLVWGSLSLSMKYLLRRAHENKDAVSRTIDARRALGKEILTRLRLSKD